MHLIHSEVIFMYYIRAQFHFFLLGLSITYKHACQFFIIVFNCGHEQLLKPMHFLCAPLKCIWLFHCSCRTAHQSPLQMITTVWLSRASKIEVQCELPEGWLQSALCESKSCHPLSSCPQPEARPCWPEWQEDLCIAKPPGVKMRIWTACPRIAWGCGIYIAHAILRHTCGLWTWSSLHFWSSLALSCRCATDLTRFEVSICVFFIMYWLKIHNCMN